MQTVFLPKLKHLAEQIRMTLKKKSKRLTTDGSLKHVQRVRETQ